MRQPHPRCASEAHPLPTADAGQPLTAQAAAAVDLEERSILEDNFLFGPQPAPCGETAVNPPCPQQCLPSPSAHPRRHPAHQTHSRPSCLSPHCISYIFPFVSTLFGFHKKSLHDQFDRSSHESQRVGSLASFEAHLGSVFGYPLQLLRLRPPLLFRESY